MQRGDIVICAIVGDYGKPRPAVVIQSDLFNATHASITLCPITTTLVQTPLFRLEITPTLQNGLLQLSQIMVDKITTLKREKIHAKIGTITPKQLSGLENALKLWLGFMLS